MNFFSQNIPTYLYKKKNLIRLVFFTALFALVFINIYKPFNSEHWYNVSVTKFFIYSSLIILTGILVVVMSRITMYYHTKKNTITYGVYYLWVLFEILAMSCFYTLYTFKLNPSRDLLSIFQSSTINTSLVILLPYSVLWLYFSWQDKVSRIEMLEMLDDSTDLNYGKKNIVSFYDEKGEFRFSVKRDNMLYIESADNYINVWYMNKGIVSKYMIRNSLKAMETLFADTNVMRCHRSYIVNLEQVKVIKREKTGVFLQMDIDGVPDIQISKTYIEKIMSWFGQFSS